MNQLQIFSNSQFGEVRVATTESNEPLFCLADLCRILNLQTNKVKERLNEKGWNTIPTLTNGGMQDMIFVDEPNFYKAVFQSRKPEAEAFTEWVTSEVLPSIRKHGAYLTPAAIEEVLTNPDTIIQLATNLKAEREKRLAAERDRERLAVTTALQTKELKEAAPKVQYFEDVMQSDSLHCTNIIAKELGMGAPTLNRKLRDLRVQYRQGDTWVLYERYQNKGYTKSKTHTFTDNRTGETRTAIHTYWTEKGRHFIHNLLKSHIPITSQSTEEMN